MKKNGYCINCGFCKKPFYVSLSRIKVGKKYCKKDCQNKSQIGSPGYWIGKKRYGYITNTSFKKGLTPWNKGIKWDRMRGENNPKWVGGAIKHPDKRIRRSIDYILWRTAVFMRDDYTCQGCNIRGGNLQADHIKPFALFPELRFAIDNGRTLCIECHKKTDTYARNIHMLKKLYPESKVVMPT